MLVYFVACLEFFQSLWGLGGGVGEDLAQGVMMLFLVEDVVIFKGCS